MLTKGRSYYKSSLVIVDEVGYTPINREECNLFFRFIANRYEKASTVITSNKVFSEWTEMFHDPVIVTAILDRLLHHSTVINIRGNSYRLRGKISDRSQNLTENKGYPRRFYEISHMILTLEPHDLQTPFVKHRHYLQAYGCYCFQIR